MKTIDFDQETCLTRPLVATIGFFDGVHKGHQYLINHVVQQADELGCESAVITFRQHPRQVLDADYCPKELSDFDEKQLLLSKTRVENVIALNFDESLAAMTAREFMEKILYQKLCVRRLLIGYDNRFGKDRAETFEDYVRHGREIGIEVLQSQPFVLNGERVSSSLVRRYLEAGEMELAAFCLGYPYTLRGKVVHGVKKGREIGFPTANLVLEDQRKLIPDNGVYAVKVRLENSLEMKHAMMNIGTRPTFGDNRRTMEVHILNFSGDLYGQRLSVSFIHRLREEKAFETESLLIEQLHEDKRLVTEQFIKEQENDE